MSEDHALGEEDHSLAQFWYSPATLKILRELCKDRACIGLLSTPSVFFMLDLETRARCVLFEYDRKWETDNDRFRFFDYQAGLVEVNREFEGQCDLIVADPPRIQPDVVDEYMKVVRMLLAPGGRIVFTSAMENERHFIEEHGLFACNFVPKASAAWAAMGRFRLYTNFTEDALRQKNIDDFPGGGADEDDYSEDISAWHCT
eukprot:TRINITY_DN12233_c1_g2_i1.p1 TRINITY_DN12233_c1_g2~~TRINITY_DN12233_c1_g2_i1.p1  ORF type:complete len:218 (-),score=28.24 TRINITY_DN12233_c1_g2_i1:362-967(-)